MGQANGNYAVICTAATAGCPVQGGSYDLTNDNHVDLPGAAFQWGPGDFAPECTVNQERLATSPQMTTIQLTLTTLVGW